ncbi:DUF2313 domain-containing protein [Roseomonas sp. HJA6]|uniref:DUF2313 domain-containing protein n=1 Tax=Roseomonas alba TaxID=2846776 RepID=A0ABS7AI72_9PROT|nr:putative phage tail protein [Neoroseomonas alba]MBW6402024.1 DUF2313 domain-containing protein [Neoroseomonas alba]
MSRSTDDMLHELLAELPPGDALPAEPGSVVGRFFRPIAVELADFEALRERLIAQISPANAQELLEDYERILGPDPCRADVSSLSIDERQRRAELRWNGPSTDLGPDALVDAAATLGVTITVETFAPGVCGVGECGDELSDEDEVYGWWVHAPVYSLIDGECGGSECGDPINDFTGPDLDCPLAQFVPPHRFLRISYDLET